MGDPHCGAELPCRTAGPGLADVLLSASTEVADELGALSVAFPLISSGIYGWPRLDAIAAAIETIAGAATRVEEVRIVAFDSSTYNEVHEQLSTYH
ncbi:appr-1-p processing domain-containing protein [Mycolicibacterium conceptionense]|uniref:Appr-1-p processing domain-containing protein n=1 Tax=Mycolicibacterium conceptionense TaxID=451644 RepID=A0A0U1D4C2_9MYCO|nr:appr-1-p processing domain-containing protein [Mycolicibacterium conceptionense]